jgi:tetratricopeptide (TPR) repeat protein
MSDPLSDRNAGIQTVPAARQNIFGSLVVLLLWFYLPAQGFAEVDIQPVTLPDCDTLHTATIAVNSAPADQALRPGVSAYHSGLRCIRQNEPDSALYLLRTAVELDPELYHAHIALGRQLLQAWDLAGADKAAHRAIMIDPIHPDSYHLLGDIALSRQQLPAAEQWLRTALALHTDREPSGALHNKIGLCFWESGNRDLALRYLLKAYQQSSGTLSATIIDSLLEQRDIEAAAALADLYEQFSIDPGYSVSESVQDYIEETYRVEMENQSFISALSIARKLTQLDSTQSRYRIYTVQALISLGQLTEARQMLESLPETADNTLALARLYVRCDSLDQALINYRIAWELLPHTIDLELEIGELYLYAGLVDSALVFFKNACDRGDSPACEQVRLLEDTTGSGLQQTPER